MVPPAHGIVVGVDYSEVGDHAFDAALQIACERGHCKLHAIHVLPVVSSVSPTELGEVFSEPEPHVLDAAGQALQSYVQMRIRRFESLSANYDPSKQDVARYIQCASPAHRIAALASDVGADLVVVGTHGRTGAKRWFLGSVAEQVVRIAPCTVLVVRAPQTSDEFT